MIANLHNENYGYSTAIAGYWAAIANPEFVAYDPLTASLVRTGSVEVYKYNVNNDTHDLKGVILRHLSPQEDILLVTEAFGSFYYSGSLIDTEATGTFPYSANKDILVDVGNYYSKSDDSFGFSIDMYGTLLAVGCPYFSSTAHIGTASFLFTSSGEVQVFDVSRMEIDPFAQRLPVAILGYDTGSSNTIVVNTATPPNQQYSSIILESQDATDITSPWVKVNEVAISNLGGSIPISTGFSIFDAALYTFRVRGIVGTDPFLVLIPTPNTVVSESFGTTVSINNGWLAIGSPGESGSKGAVFMYKQNTGSFVSWSLYQTISPPADICEGDFFGRDIALNKWSGSYSGSMVVGSAKPSSSHAYVYEFDGTNWNLSWTLNPDYYTNYPLTFYPTYPIYSGSYPNIFDHYGWSVGMSRDTIVVGAPFDRHVYEYSGSYVYDQGSVYFYERCPDPLTGYYLARKSYGNEKILKDNRLGWSVDVWGDYAVVGSPKTNMLSMSICYLRGSLYQQHYCGDIENQIQGQFVLYNQTTGSIPDTTFLDWEITNVYQIKKRMLVPYRALGFDVDIGDQFISVGAPMLVSNHYKIMDMTPSSGSFTGSLSDITDITGKAYIYNLKNLRENYYVGNAFYRNGKFVIMSSGSAFDGLLSSNIQGEDYEYDMYFKSKQTVFEKQIVCPVAIGEFNVSTNPSALVFPTSSYDINQNGQFDFQDCDVLLRYMAYKNTEVSGRPNTDWSSSVLATNTDEEVTVYNMYSSSWTDTDTVFIDNYSKINNTLYNDLDFNNDNRLDLNDMNILWKYFIYRLTQKNYETWVTPNSQNKYLSDILDYLNERTMRGQAPSINPNFLDYNRLSQADPTGSYLAPYVTTIGLYNGCDLIAVAKLGSPIKITPDFPFNFVVKIDF